MEQDRLYWKWYANSIGRPLYRTAREKLHLPEVGAIGMANLPSALAKGVALGGLTAILTEGNAPLSLIMGGIGTGISLVGMTGAIYAIRKLRKSAQRIERENNYNTYD